MHHTNGSLLTVLLPLIVVGILLVLGIIYMNRKGYYGASGNKVVVRCRQGHLFTTIWIPFASFKAVRLGPIRYQYCPVGNHWAFVDLVDPSGLSDAERDFAAQHHDSLIP